MRTQQKVQTGYYKVPTITQATGSLPEVISDGRTAHQLITSIEAKGRHVREEAQEFILRNLIPTTGEIYTRCPEMFDAENITGKEILKEAARRKFKMEVAPQALSSVIQCALLYRERFSQSDLGSDRFTLVCSPDLIILNETPMWFVLGKDITGEWLDLFAIQPDKEW